MFAIFHLIVFAGPKSKAQIVINEILASNTSTNLDAHNKNFPDWIELHNHSDNEISIGDWYLTDNKRKPTKWKIPYYISIAPKGFKLFWADNMNTSNHSNFRLNIEGESIYLFNKDSILVDSISYPQQVPDISFGRVRGSMNQLMYFHEATPMDENPLFGNKTLDFASNPIYSEKAGFYDKSISIELSGSSNEDKIYYSLDGSKPTQASNQYSMPIEINKNTIIRARTYSEQKLPSKITTQTYLIKESSSLPVISLVIDPTYFWDENIGIYTKGPNYIKDEWGSANYFKSWERPVNMEYFDIKGNQGFNVNVGVKIHGRSTRNNAQKTLAIYTREKYGTPPISYKLFGEKSPDTIKTFLLRNGGNDWGVTMLLDGLVHSLVIGKIDIDAQLYQPAILYLNGNYWGIHNIREKINKNYIKTKHQDVSNKIDIIEADIFAGKLQASSGNMNEYNKMIDFIENNELSIKENYDTVKKSIDINEIINYLATQAYICNCDWPGSNMKFWKDRNESGKWRWILYDTELSFKESNIYLEFNMLEHMLAENSENVNAPWSNYLFRKLFESDEFKFEFIQRMAIYLNTVFDSDLVLHTLDSLKGNIEPEIVRNINKWGGLRQNAIPFYVTSTNQAEWETNIEFVSNFAKNRPSALRKNLIKYFELKDTANLKIRISDINAGKISLMGHTLKEGNFDGYIFTDIPIRMEAIPNKGFEFVKWKGEEFEKNCVFNIKNNTKLTAVFRKIE
jgi:hypothetical protein